MDAGAYLAAPDAVGRTGAEMDAGAYLAIPPGMGVGSSSAVLAYELLASLQRWEAQVRTRIRRS